jgi:hypothetical protein
VLGVLGLRKLVRMEGLLVLRAVIISTPFWAAAFYLFSLACADMFTTGCDFINFESEVYTCTEF